MRRTRGWLLKSVRLTLLLGALAFGIYGIARDADGFVDALGTIGLARVLGALLLTAVGLFASAEVWRSAIRSAAGYMKYSDANRVYFVSQLGKYLPGGVWTVVAQMERADRYGLSHWRMGIGAILFIGLFSVTGLLVALVLLPWAAPELVAEYWWALVLTPLLVVFLIPQVLTWVMNIILAGLRRPRIPEPLKARDVLLPVTWMGFVWAAFGASAWLIASPLAPAYSSGDLFTLTTGTFALAWVLGMLVILAPAGLGPRDLVIFLALAPVAGATGATSIAVTLRILHTVADLSLAAAVGVLWRQRVGIPREDASTK